MNLTAKIYYRLTALTIILFVLVGILTLNDYGMGWDEITRWNSGDLKLSYYKSLISGKELTHIEKIANDNYPGLFDLSLAMFHDLFGGNRIIQGHLLSIMFGALGLVSAAWISITVFNARTAFYSTLILATLPMFYGHAMVNPKDIPFLGTYTLGLAIIFKIGRSIAINEAVHGKWFIFSGISLGLAASSRTAGFIIIVYGFAIWVVCLLFHGWKFRGSLRLRREYAGLLGKSVMVGLTGILIVAVFFPRLHFKLFTSLADVTAYHHTSAKDIPLIYGGKVMKASEGPATFAHGFFLLSTPLWMLGLLFAGIINEIKIQIAHNKTYSPQLLLKALFLIVAAFPWLYILISHPALHNGCRHMLFAIPPLAILMGSGLDAITRVAVDHAAWRKFTFATLFTLFLSYQIYSLYRMHPFQYVSFNLLAGEKRTIPNRYEPEYWCTSTRHLLEILPDLVEGRSDNSPIKIIIAGPIDSARLFVPEGFEIVDSFDQAEYFLANTYLRSDLLSEGKVIHVIEREGIPIAVVKKLR